MKKYLLTYKVISTYGSISPKDYMLISEGNNLVVTPTKCVDFWWNSYKNHKECGTSYIYELSDTELLEEK